AQAAAEALALTLAKEEARHGIRVNVVAPGLVATDMGERLVRAKLGAGSAVVELDAAQPFGRVTRPHDVAAAVRFLLSPAAAQITGQRIVVDGGSDAFPAAGAAARG
ncbi:MAG TPA: SDR family oxidoreductase, partial [Conexibacter sp.]|nr:SDR family oxidoreductase [Conexibacter sp.]